MNKRHFGPLIIVIILLAIGVNAFVVWQLQSEEYTFDHNDDVVIEIEEEEEVEEDQQQDHLFTIDEGMRADWASNPMVTYQDEEKIILAYEDRASELRFAPSEGSPLIETYDGLSFEEVEDRIGLSTHPEGVFIDGLYHKYIFVPSDGVMYATSEDNQTYTMQGVALEVYAEDAGDASQFGVSTFFADDIGGIVLLFNANDENGDIVVNRAYASAEDLSTLKVTDYDILGGTLENTSYADPHVVELADGSIGLIIMNQAEGPAPPLQRQGYIHLYRSYDIGTTFVYEGELFNWSHIDEFDVYSLNDPKIVQMPDGLVRVYVAAMIPDPDAVEDDDPRTGYKWILVSASGELE